MAEGGEEIVMIVVANIVGHLLDAHRRVCQQLLGLAHPHLVDEPRRREPGIFLESLAERGIAQAQLRRHLLRRDRHIMAVDHHLRLTDLVRRVRLLELRVPGVEIRETEQPVHYAGQNLLETRLLSHGGVDRGSVEVHYVHVDIHLEQRSVLREKALPDQIVDELPVEADPLFLPPRRFVRIVGMPLAREKQEHHPAFDRD